MVCFRWEPYFSGWVVCLWSQATDLLMSLFLLRPGDLCAARFSEDSLWYRVRIRGEGCCVVSHRHPVAFNFPFIFVSGVFRSAFLIAPILKQALSLSLSLSHSLSLSLSLSLSPLSLSLSLSFFLSHHISPVVHITSPSSYLQSGESGCLLPGLRQHGTCPFDNSVPSRWGIPSLACPGYYCFLLCEVFLLSKYCSFTNVWCGLTFGNFGGQQFYLN